MVLKTTSNVKGHVKERFCTTLPLFSDFLVGASLSKPHIHVDDLNIRNLCILLYIMVHPSPARRYRDCTGVRDIFQHDLEAA